LAILPDGQIAAEARKAGFAGNRQIIAVAVALAESNGDFDAHNYNLATGDDSWGLWQINMLGRMGPDRRKKLGIKSNEELRNPSVNARGAFLVYREAGGSFRPWSVYTNGRYLGYMNRARKAAQSASSGTYSATTAEFPGIPNPIEPVQEFVKFFTSGSTWQRVGLFVAGGLMITIGLALLLADTALNRIVTKVIKSALRGKNA
jgi:hypothetical protein